MWIRSSGRLTMATRVPSAERSQLYSALGSISNLADKLPQPFTGSKAVKMSCSQRVPAPQSHRQLRGTWRRTTNPIVLTIQTPAEEGLLSWVRA
jgi:hypothetical protein